MNECSHVVALASPFPGLFSIAGRGYFGWDDSAFFMFKMWKDWEEKGKDNIPSEAVKVRIGLLQQINGRYQISSQLQSSQSSRELHRISKLSVIESAANLFAIYSPIFPNGRYSRR